MKLWKDGGFNSTNCIVNTAVDIPGSVEINVLIAQIVL